MSINNLEYDSDATELILLQESFKRFQHFIDLCSKNNSRALDKALRMQSSLKPQDLTSLPKTTMNTYSSVRQLELQTAQILRNISVNIFLFEIS